MPILKTQSVTVSTVPYQYVVGGNSNGVATWTLQSSNGSFGTTGHFSIGVRQVNAKQSTRKTTAVYSDPLVDTCATTCKVTSRGAVMFRLENVTSVDSTLAERELAFDRFVALLTKPDARTAFVNNEAFYS